MGEGVGRVVYAWVEEGVKRDVYRVEGGSEEGFMQVWRRDVCRCRGGRYTGVREGVRRDVGTGGGRE